ncbi:hypothetical protein, partial [Arthrobacter ramosus]
RQLCVNNHLVNNRAAAYCPAQLFPQGKLMLAAREFRPALAKSRQVKRHPDQPFRKAHSVCSISV